MGNRLEAELRYSAVTGIPLTFLLGQSPQGLNATGKGEERIYYDMISVRQENKMRKPLNKLIEYIQLAKEGSTKGKIIDGWKIVFNPLWQQTQEQIVESRNKQSETDKTYIENGVLTPEEVRESRFGGNEYSHETKIEVEDE